jgi:hypothetical protein
MQEFTVRSLENIRTISCRPRATVSTRVWCAVYILGAKYTPYLKNKIEQATTIPDRDISVQHDDRVHQYALGKV